MTLSNLPICLAVASPIGRLSELDFTGKAGGMSIELFQKDCGTSHAGKGSSQNGHNQAERGPIIILK
jgi:hypothetical protein